MKRLSILAFSLLPLLAIAQDAASVATPALPQQATFGQQIAAQVIPPLSIALLGVALAAIGALTRWLNSKAKESTSARVAEQVSGLTLAVVQDLEATLKAEYEKRRGGGISPEEAAELRQIAITRLKLSLGTRGLETLKTTLGIGAEGLQFVLGGFVERAVATVSAESAESVPAAPVVPVVASVPTMPLAQP